MKNVFLEQAMTAVNYRPVGEWTETAEFLFLCYLKHTAGCLDRLKRQEVGYCLNLYVRWIRTKTADLVTVAETAAGDEINMIFRDATRLERMAGKAAEVLEVMVNGTA